MCWLKWHLEVLFMIYIFNLIDEFIYVGLGLHLYTWAFL